MCIGAEIAQAVHACTHSFMCARLLSLASVEVSCNAVCALVCPYCMPAACAPGARRLLDALQRGPARQHLALPMLILVAQQRQAIMVRTEAQHIKFVVELYDKCHETTTQYIEFLQVGFEVRVWGLGFGLGFESCTALWTAEKESVCCRSAATFALERILSFKKSGSDFKQKQSNAAFRLFTPLIYSSPTSPAPLFLFLSSPFSLPGPALTQTALSFEDYCRLVPPVDVLRTQYKLDSEIVFLVGVSSQHFGLRWHCVVLSVFINESALSTVDLTRSWWWLQLCTRHSSAHGCACGLTDCCIIVRCGGQPV